MANQVDKIVTHINAQIEHHAKRADDASRSFNLINLCKAHLDRKDELEQLLKVIQSITQ